jgi:TolA-binding protein
MALGDVPGFSVERGAWSTHETSEHRTYARRRPKRDGRSRRWIAGHLPVPFVFAAALAVSGCFWTTTKSEGQAMRRDIDTLQSKISDKEKVLDGQIGELKQVLDDATKILKRNSADLGADVDKLRDDIRVATGLVTAVGNEMATLREQVAKDSERIAAMDARLGALEAKAPNPANPGTPDEIWTLGKTAFEAQRWVEAHDLFKKLVVSFPTHVRAPDAQYFRAEALLKKGDVDGAIGEYQKLVDKYGDSQLADDALYRAGEAAYSLKNCTEARAYYGLLKQKYAKSTLIKQAEAKDKEIKGALKNKAKCTS